MTTKSTDSASRLTAKEYAALHTKVPQSGTEWLDSMIQAARDLDAEPAQKTDEKPASHAQSAGRAKRSKKEPELRDQKD